jgi:phospholipid transport system substrate-binding protein
MRPLRLLFGIAIAVSLAVGFRSYAEPVRPSVFVSTLANQVLVIFNDPKLSFAEREQQMHALAIRDFDVPYTARFTLGPYWKTATEKERAEFIEVYEDYIVHIYARQFDTYHDVDFKVLSERPEAPTHAVVETEIVRHDGRPPIRVHWRVETKGQSPKITDVSVEGISQVLSLREQFAELIEHDQGGVPMLISRLREKTRA